MTKSDATTFRAGRVPCRRWRKNARGSTSAEWRIRSSREQSEYNPAAGDVAFPERPPHGLPDEGAQQAVGVAAGIGRHHLDLAIGFLERQVPEEQPMARGRPLVDQRPLDFEPAVRDAGRAVLLRQRIVV